MQYDKMKDCFAAMQEKTDYALHHTDLPAVFDVLNSIKGPTIITGSGGSYIVAIYLSKVLAKKNGIITVCRSPRDIPYMSLEAFENIITVSYSGNNLGVRLSFANDLNHYLFTGNAREETNNIVYQMPAEHSYVSVNATVIPLSILFLYYRDDRDLLKQILAAETGFRSNNHQYEVFSGFETLTASTLLESSIIEAGFGTCIIHDKYNYCHGRMNIIKNTDADMILFDSGNELDQTLEEHLSYYYKNIFLFERKYEDDLIDDFYQAILSLKLVRNIGEELQIDISDMKELPDNDSLYLFDGTVK